MAHPVPDIHPEQVGKRKKPGPLAGTGLRFAFQDQISRGVPGNDFARRIAGQL
jgi:hypothetical protein